MVIRIWHARIESVVCAPRQWMNYWCLPLIMRLFGTVFDCDLHRIRVKLTWVIVFHDAKKREEIACGWKLLLNSPVWDPTWWSHTDSDRPDAASGSATISASHPPHSRSDASYPNPHCAHRKRHTVTYAVDVVARRPACNIPHDHVGRKWHLRSKLLSTQCWILPETNPHRHCWTSNGAYLQWNNEWMPINAIILLLKNWVGIVLIELHLNLWETARCFVFGSPQSHQRMERHDNEEERSNCWVKWTLWKLSPSTSSSSSSSSSSLLVDNNNNAAS